MRPRLATAGSSARGRGSASRPRSPTFPKEILHPPREWAERTLGDLRQWTEHDRGGHFAAWEEPELLARDIVGFLREV